MRLTINGEPREIPGAADVAGLVAALSLDARKVAVERNLEIVPRSLYKATPLSDGDRIEIVHFIGGG
jgi:thiamine biosynthesis protein ThiS